MTDQIERLDVRADDNISAAMNAGADALNRVADAADNVTVAVEQVGRSATSFVKRNDDITKAATALNKVLKEQSDQIKAFALATDQGKGDAEAFARSNQNLAEKVEAARVKLAELRAEAAGSVPPASAMTDAMRKAAEQHDAQAKAAKGGAMALRDLAIQSQDLFVQIQGGGSIMTAFIQQGSQVSQQLMASGQGFGALRAAGSMALGALLTPIGLAVAGVTALAGSLAFMVSSGNASAGALATLQQSLRGTHEAYAALGVMVESVGRKVAASSGLGLKEAVAVAAQLAQGRYFAGTAADLERLTRDAADMGAAMGGTAADGAKTLAEALDDPSKAAETLAPRFSALTGPLREQIDNLQRAGKSSEAFALLLGTLEGAAGGAARSGLSPLARAWQDLGNAFTGSTNGWRPFFEWLANTAASVIDTLTAAINRLSGAFRDAKSIATAGGFDTKQFDGKTGGAAAAAGTAPQVTQAVPTASATKDAFVAQWTEAARQAGSALGVSPNILIAQWGLESGWGKSAYNNNVGNIKAQDGYGGASFQNPGDKLAYRSYADPAAFATDFVNVVMQKWPAVKGTGDNAAAYAAALRPGQQGGYAEDPNYAAKLTGTAAGMAAPSGMVDDTKKTNDALQERIKLTREYKALGYAADLDQLTAALQKEAETNGTGTARFKQLSQAIEETAKGIYGNVSAMDAAQRSADSNLRATAGLTAGEQALSAAVEQRAQAAKAAGEAFTDGDKAAAINSLLQAQSQEYGRVTYAMSLASAQQDEIAAAYSKGNQSVIDVTAGQAAYNESVRLFPRGSKEASAAMAELISYYKVAATEASLAKTAQDNLQSRDQLAYIQAETTTLGQNEQQRGVLLATMTAEQEMHRRFGDVLPEEAKQYVALKAATAGATSEFQHQQATLNEVSGFFSSTFDTISNAITQAFATGQLQALKFGDVMKSVLSAIVAEFAKLALLNPLKNLLFGGNATTLSDVGGLVGSLFGGSSSGVAGVAGVAGAAATGIKALGAASSSGGLPDGATTVGAGLLDKALGQISGGQVTGLASLGSYIVGQVSNALGNASAATNIALTGAGFGSTAGVATAPFGAGGLAVADLGQGVSGVVGATEVGAASAANAVGASDATAAALSGAASTVAKALPYIGIAISLVTDLLQGNYRGAGLVAGGAVIGGIAGSIIPGGGTAIGAAVGAAVGGLVDAFFPQHKLNPYVNTELNVQGGQLVAGKTVGQLYDLDDSKKGVQDYADAINAYLKSVSVVITNPDMNLAGIGKGITGMNQTTDPNTAFNRLSFANDPNDVSNFGVAKGALVGQTFANPQALSDALAKIAGFADAASALGFKLAEVGSNLTNIRIASVDGANPGAISTVQDENGRVVSYLADIRTALNADLTSQTFANSDAIDAEIAKVGAFLGTLPALLTPAKSVASPLQDDIQKLNQRYADAAAQSRSYGLDNDAVLHEANVRAVDIMMKPAIDEVRATMAGVNVRHDAALYGSANVAGATMSQLAVTQEAERTQMDTQWRQTWGDGIQSNQAYIASMRQLIETQNAEAVAAQRQADVTYATAASGVAASAADYAKRSGASTIAETALAAFDANAAQEKAAFIQQWTAFYGESVTSAAWFQSELTQVDSAHYKERLALQAQYVQTSQGMQSVADRNAAGQAITSLTTYAQSLQTSSASPLSAQSQYSLASGQFNAVSGAAAAGDYNSLTKLQSYADSFLSASRALNGSGADYAADFQRVLTALGNAAASSPDALTGSYMASIAQQQTDQLVAELQALRAEVSALRAETMQASGAPARVAA